MGLLVYAILAGSIIILLLAYEMSRWPVRGRLLTRRQKIARVASGIVALAILSLMVLGGQASEAGNSISALMYWMICLALAFGLVALALLDLRDIGIGYGEQRKRIIHDLTTGTDENAGSQESKNT
ncbi:MAG: hypothetical protein QHH26_09725 [Armatimonadota bacterium]|nr:hypothetical protein [Armatimonadota bacterium]